MLTWYCVTISIAQPPTKSPTTMVSVIPVLGVPRRESETESESGQKATLKSLPLPPPLPPLPSGAGELRDR